MSSVWPIRSSTKSQPAKSCQESPECSDTDQPRGLPSRPLDGTGVCVRGVVSQADGHGRGPGPEGRRRGELQKGTGS